MTIYEKEDALFRRLQGIVERRRAELLDTDEYREARSRMLAADPYDIGPYADVLEIEEKALRQAERESERTDVYREWLAQADRVQGVMELMLPRTETYENGHQTFYGRNGEVIGENLA